MKDGAGKVTKVFFTKIILNIFWLIKVFSRSISAAVL